MQLHLFKFSRRQFARFVQDVFGYCQFAHVVEECRCFNGFNQSLIAHSDFDSETRCI